MSETTFAQYLKDNSRVSHDSVDELVMSAKPFDSLENYGKFLKLQSVFHRIVDDIYKAPEWNEKIEGLAPLARYEVVLQDMADLGVALPELDLELPKPEGMEALGWLYCAEGSNVGAAFLYKDAKEKLGLSNEHGARHLGPHADGRGKHWRSFVDQLNKLGIQGQDQEAALQGALNAFAFYKVLLRAIF